MHSEEAVLKEAYRILLERQKREKEEVEKSKNPFDQRNRQPTQPPPRVHSDPLPNPYPRNPFAPQGDPPPVRTHIPLEVLVIFNEYLESTCRDTHPLANNHRNDPLSTALAKISTRCCMNPFCV
jgi:hypothetical protein